MPVPRDVSRDLADRDETWQAPTLSDFTDRAWEELSDAEKRRIAGHFAWMPDSPPERFTDLKLPHHRPSDGRVVWRGVVAAMAALLGARGGVEIPDSERRAVYEHLASHYRQYGEEPPDFREITFDPHGRERRSLPLEMLEVRADDGKRKIAGYAAVFEQLSEPLYGGFREKIARGAFKKTLREADVRALWNHDPNYVLGRTKSGTLKLREDDRGLVIEIDPPDTQWARDLMTSIERGDIDQMSFGFRVVKDDWERKPDGTIIRILKEVQLFDVSPVTFPAYPQTSVQVRDMLRALDESSRPEGHSERIRRLRLKLDLIERSL